MRFLFTSTPKHFSHFASVSFVLIIIRIRIQRYIGPIVPGLVVVRNYHTNHYCCLLIRTSSIKECRFFHNLLLFVTEEFHLRRALKPRPSKFLPYSRRTRVCLYNKISTLFTYVNQYHHRLKLWLVFCSIIGWKKWVENLLYTRTSVLQ